MVWTKNYWPNIIFVKYNYYITWNSKLTSENILQTAHHTKSSYYTIDIALRSLTFVRKFLMWSAFGEIQVKIYAILYAAWQMWYNYLWKINTVLFAIKEHKGLNRSLGRPGRRWKDNINMDRRKIGCEGVGWIHLVLDTNQLRALMSTVMLLRVP